MKEFWEQEYSSYETPTIDVIQITWQDVVRTSLTPDQSSDEGGGGANNDWWT